MPEINVQDEQGTIHSFPDGSTPEMIAAAMKVKPPMAASAPQQTTQPLGFLKSFASDLSGMLPHSLGEAAQMSGKGLLRATTMGVSDLPGMYQSVRNRLQAGNSVPYALGAAEAEGLGANVGGMEKSASEGDPAGVLGHAAVVPAMLATGEAVGRGLPFLKDTAQPAIDQANNAIASRLRYPATARQSQIGRPGTVKNVLPAFLQKWSIPEGLIPKGTPGSPTNPGPFVEIPWKSKPPVDNSLVYRDATRLNEPFAGEDIPDVPEQGGLQNDMPRPLRPTIGTPEEWQRYQDQMARLKAEASDAGMYSAARGKAGKKLNYQQRIEKSF